MTTAILPTVANDTVCELGEGPVWDPVRHRVMWLDVRAGTVFSGQLSPDGAVEVVHHDSYRGTVGAVSVADDGTWLIAGAKSLFARLPGGGTRLLAAIIPEKDARRTNDGKADPAGRFVVGTLSLNGDSRTESLVRLEPDGSLTTLDDDLTLSNGMAWTADGRTMYSIDTLRRIIYTRPYDPVTGLVGKRDVLVQCEAGFPDGMCLDEEEHLWVAMWGLGQVHRFTPKGERVAVIDVPAPHVSSVAFAGPDLATLVITTATQDLDPDQLSAYPLSGQLFTASPGVRGLPVPLWSGVTPPVESRTS